MCATRSGGAVGSPVTGRLLKVSSGSLVFWPILPSGMYSARAVDAPLRWLAARCGALSPCGVSRSGVTSFDCARARDPPEPPGSSGPRCGKVRELFPESRDLIPFMTGRVSRVCAAGTQVAIGAWLPLFLTGVCGLPKVAGAIGCVSSASKRE